MTVASVCECDCVCVRVSAAEVERHRTGDPKGRGTVEEPEEGRQEVL